ncbi:hypothetical protein P4105_29525 [Pseudomonas aeruginosa]|nr:hypothetical protein [Pseudomonas aeruginosa]
MIFELVADRYQVAEIKDIARTRDIHRQVMPSSGVKKNLGFIYHEPGRAVDMGKALQFNVPSEHGENHLYRPDVDAHLLNAAVRYGATVFSVGTDARIELHDDKGCGSSPGKASGSLPTSWSMAAIAGPRWRKRCRGCRTRRR